MLLAPRRQRKHLLSEPKLVEYVQRRRMNGVATEVAKEISVFLEDDDPIPARAKRYPSIIPAGPPPMMQHVVRITFIVGRFESKARGACRAPSAYPTVYD